MYGVQDKTLDCWQVTIGLRPSQQLLWSSQTVLAANAALGTRMHVSMLPGYLPQPLSCNAGVLPRCGKAQLSICE